jgi:hypothetical protein
MSPAVFHVRYSIGSGVPSRRLHRLLHHLDAQTRGPPPGEERPTRSIRPTRHVRPHLRPPGPRKSFAPRALVWKKALADLKAKSKTVRDDRPREHRRGAERHRRLASVS